MKNLLLREIENDDFEEVHEFASQEEVCRYQAWGLIALKIRNCDVLNEGSKVLLEKVSFKKTSLIKNHINK